jgi:hypothetical protein
VRHLRVAEHRKVCQLATTPSESHWYAGVRHLRVAEHQEMCQLATLAIKSQWGEGANALGKGFRVEGRGLGSFVTLRLRCQWAEVFLKKKVNVRTNDDFTKSVDARVNYMFPGNEEMKAV